MADKTREAFEASAKVREAIARREAAESMRERCAYVLEEMAAQLSTDKYDTPVRNLLIGIAAEIRALTIT